jgi:hypothetical protein
MVRQRAFNLKTKHRFGRFFQCSQASEEAVYTIDILVNLDGEQNKMFGENLCAFCMAAVPREMYFIVEP